MKLAGTPSLPVSCHHHRPRPTQNYLCALGHLPPLHSTPPPPQTARPPGVPGRGSSQRPPPETRRFQPSRCRSSSTPALITFGETIGLAPARPPARLLAGEGGGRSLNETRDSPPPRGLLQPCATSPSLQVPPGSLLPAPRSQRAETKRRRPPAPGDGHPPHCARRSQAECAAGSTSPPHRPGPKRGLRGVPGLPAPPSG